MATQINDVHEMTADEQADLQRAQGQGLREVRISAEELGISGRGAGSTRIRDVDEREADAARHASQLGDLVMMLDSI